MGDKMNSNKPEVLSPVGNKEMLTAAVRSGADAVYLGLCEFNARRNAENFTLDDLKDVVEYCHIRGVKVYLTLNIAIKDTEFENAVSEAVAAAKCNIDGIIIADMGLASVLKNVIPDVPLHASTQMTVHSPSALTALKAAGFKRVVVSREMSRRELAEFCSVAQELNIEVEAFVHGALCMCMSGQCLLSAMLGGRSGNRGLCAGPCRLPFKVQNGSGYDLSLKDLSLIPHITELEQMGVKSFKIEGRMKKPEYVAAATAACRQMLDNGNVDERLSQALEKVFSRSGFTDGYYTEKLGKNMFGIRTKEDISASDDVLSYLHGIYRNERQSVEITGNIQITSDNGIKFTVNDGSNTVTVYGDKPEFAINKPSTESRIYEQLAKTGNTPYKFKDISAEIESGLSVRASSLNAIRRNALEQLNAARAAFTPVSSNSFALSCDAVTYAAKNTATVARLDNISQCTPAVQKCDMVTVPIDTNVSLIPQGCTFAVEMPRGISKERYIESRLKDFKEVGVQIAVCHTLTSVVLANRHGFKIVGGFGLNIFNSYTVNYYADNGAVAITVSSEMLLSDIRSVESNIPKGIISYGQIPLMLMRNCPVKNGTGCDNCGRNSNITDRKQVSFPIRCRNGYSELLNSKVIWLADRKKEVCQNIDFEILYFTDESPMRVDEVLSKYKSGSSPDCDFTRGLYFRGVE